MTEKPTTPVTGTAAGVPYLVSPPAGGGPAPVIVAWHLMDAPRSEAAFAAALPLSGLPAWRVYLGLPMFGARTPPGGRDDVLALAAEDYVLNLFGPVVEQAAAELPDVLAVLRERFPMSPGPIGVLGGSAGAAAALLAMVESPVPIAAGALVNPAVAPEVVVGLGEELFGITYRWSDASRSVNSRLDFPSRAAQVAGPAPGRAVLVVSGDEDAPAMREGAGRLRDAVAAELPDPTRASLLTVPGLGHALAEEPGIAPAPQWPRLAPVDARIADFFRAELPGLAPAR
jgi:alpha-beta hydrolase superfamily lysophospholipase